MLPIRVARVDRSFVRSFARYSVRSSQATEQSVEDMAIDVPQYSNVSLFLGRLQCLPVQRQNLMFDYFTVSRGIGFDVALVL